jgi:hypothetical protein
VAHRYAAEPACDWANTFGGHNPGAAARQRVGLVHGILEIRSKPCDYQWAVLEPRPTSVSPPLFAIALDSLPEAG